MTNIVQKILAARDVINAGEALSKPELWANSTAAAGVLSVAIIAILKFIPNGESIDQQTIDALAYGITAAWTIFSSFVHVGTHKDAGLPTKRTNRK